MRPREESVVDGSPIAIADLHFMLHFMIVRAVAPSHSLFGYFHRFIILIHADFPPGLQDAISLIYLTPPSSSFVPHIPTYCSRTRLYFHTHGSTRLVSCSSCLPTRWTPFCNNFLDLLIMLRNSCSIPMRMCLGLIKYSECHLFLQLFCDCPVVSIYPCTFMFLRLE